MEDYKIYTAPKDLIYIKKGDIKSFGKVVVLSEETDLTIKDYTLMDEIEHKIQIEKIK